MGYMMCMLKHIVSNYSEVFKNILPRANCKFWDLVLHQPVGFLVECLECTKMCTFYFDSMGETFPSVPVYHDAVKKCSSCMDEETRKGLCNY